MNEHLVIFQPSGRQGQIADGTTLLDAARQLGVDVDMTVSCYDPSTAGEPCGRCDACRLREKGFAEYAARHAPHVG